MPLVTITTTDVFSKVQSQAIADGVHAAIVASGFPERDRFQKLLVLDQTHLIYDPTHPDLETPRSDRFVLVEITLSKGRDTAFKKMLVSAVVDRVTEAVGNAPRDVMVVLTEIERENWAFHSGIQYYVEAGS